MATTEAPTATEYIVHHLTHLSTGKQKFIVDFSVFNLDTIFFSVLMLACVLLMLRAAARRATPGVPGKFQAFVEMLVEMVEEQSKSIVHGDRSFIAPLALTVFLWIIFMNAIDLIPVDLIPWIGNTALPWITGGRVDIHYLRPLPTADLNGTAGMSFGVLLLMIYYAVKIKGFGGWVHELFYAPFGNVKLSANPLTWIGFALMSFANFGLNLIEYLAKMVSLGMRLFGNMYAGELLFFLIALLGGTFGAKLGLGTWLGWGLVLIAYLIATFWLFRAGKGLLGTAVLFLAPVAAYFAQPSFPMAVLHAFAGAGWLLFHILIVLLQAFIFMMLTMVYIGQAHEAH